MQAAWIKHPPHLWQPGTLDRQALALQAAQLQAQPDFTGVCHQFATQLQAAYQNSWALNRVMREHARFALVAFVMYLHHQAGRSEPGVTYSRVVQLFAAGQQAQVGALATPTRIKAMLSLAVLTGQLQRVPASGDRRVKLLVPTDKMIAPSLQWLRGVLQAIAPVLPLADTPQRLAALPGFLGEVLSYQVLAYLHDQFTLHESFAGIQRIMRRENGYVTLMEIVRTMHPSGDQWLAAAPSVSLAERFQSSRGTVRNIVQEAMQEGWLHTSDRGGHTLALSPAFASDCQRWVAYEMVWMAGLANAAAQRLSALRG